MANFPTYMELELALSQKNSPQPQLTLCEQLKFNKAKMETFSKCKQACVDAFRQMPDHYPEEPFFVRDLTELQDLEETMALAVSDIDSYEPCTIPGCPHQEKTPINSPTKLTQSTPKISNQLPSEATSSLYLLKKQGSEALQIIYLKRQEDELAFTLNLALYQEDLADYINFVLAFQSILNTLKPSEVIPLQTAVDIVNLL
ncbi:hypothetical protein TNIN_45781 [Trichonephila inaurata madagascariensis]|uniref:Uncharacterized protein n=1 Tax=Trichonephila inaurata madagascariensis TaxID=2747483 RepID=A0A8X7C0M4_9ARAC|nr:hypothetical protein TNIN_45781 [Trichonephila inaurata madagascariensis]